MVKNRTASLPQSEFAPQGLASTFRLENVLLGCVCTWGDYCLFPLPQTSQWETVLLSLSSLPRRLSWLPRRGKTQPHSPVPSLEMSQTLTGLKDFRLYNCICMEKIKLGVLMLVHVLLFVTVNSVRVQKQILMPQKWTADQKSSCRLHCPPPPLTPPSEMVWNWLFFKYCIYSTLKINKQLITNVYKYLPVIYFDK